ncbi:MAG: hypothetical protein OHK0040_10260 [bacterium]
MKETLIKFTIINELDIVLARKKAREIANLLGFDNINEVKFATGVSEITRNAFRYAGGGEIEFYLELTEGSLPKIMVRVEDRGRGIKNLDEILTGRYNSNTGLGTGIFGTKKIMDIFEIETSEQGTTVLMGKFLSNEIIASLNIQQIKAKVTTVESGNALEELIIQNKDILKALDEINRKKAELEELSKNLYKTNEELLKMQSVLKDLAIKDPLTGVYNRLKLNEILNYEISYTKRHKDPLSLIMFDIDLFKMVNDQFGHQKGDEVLIKMAEIASTNLRKTDFLFRYGGEEFCIIVKKTNGEGALLVAERIRKKIEATDFGIPKQITASFGIAEYIDGESAEGFIKRADDALYIAKKSGRNRAILLS